MFYHYHRNFVIFNPNIIRKNVSVAIKIFSRNILSRKFMYFDETHVKYESKPQLEPFFRWIQLKAHYFTQCMVASARQNGVFGSCASIAHIVQKCSWFFYRLVCFFSLLFCCVLLSLRNVELRPRMNAEYQKPYGYRVGCVPHGEPLHKSNEWARLEYRCCSSVLHRLLIITIVCVSFLEIFSSVFSRVYS